MPKPFEEVPAGPIDGENRTFKLSHTPMNNFVSLQLNEVQMNPFIPQFTVQGRTVTYTDPPKPGDRHSCFYFEAD